MLNIPDNIMNDFTNGTTTKQIELELEGYDYPADELNYFVSDGSDREWKALKRTSSGTDYVQFYNSYVTDEYTMTKPFYAPIGSKLMYLSMDIYFESFPSNARSDTPLRFLMQYDGFVYEAIIDITKAKLQAATKAKPIRINMALQEREGKRMWEMFLYLVDSSNAKLNFKVWYKNISITEKYEAPYHISLVKDFKLPQQKKIITNEHIEKGQMSLTESLCSADDLLFGSAEASCLNIGVVDTSEDFNGRYIKPSFVWESKPSEYNFDVVNWSAEDTNIEYIQKYGNSDLNYSVGHRVNMSVYDIFNNSNGWKAYEDIAYGLEYGMRVLFKTVNFTGNDTPPSKLIVSILYKHEQNGQMLSSDKVFNIGADGVWVDETFSFFKPFNASDSVYKLMGATYYFADANGSPLAENYGTYGEFSIFVLNVGIYLHKEEKKDTVFVKGNQYIAYGIDPTDIIKGRTTIPLGRFKVDQVQKTVTHTLTKKNISAYDECYNLEQNASDWYTFYMFGVNSYQYNSAYGFEYARQIYSSYFNLAKQLGIESIDYENEEEILRYEESEGTASSRFASDFSKAFNNGSSGTNFLHYTKSTINNADSNYLYRVRMEHKDYMSDRSIVQFELGSQFSKFNDPYGRGFISKCSICIAEYDSNNALLNKYLVDSDDYFKISDECVKFDVYVPYGWNQSATASSNLHKYVNRVFIYRLYKPFKLTNASSRLVYYKYFKTSDDNDIFACDSSITARDVIKSILEMTGCFYHIDRYGKPKFVYCTKSGLYPSNTLYPADDLYPRTSVDGQLLAMGKYITFVADDYVVRDIGRIQILKDTNSNESKSVCEWEYIGDKDNDNTYVIDSNIFYCNEELEYEYDAMPEVAEMLEKLYMEISNLGYVPNTTVCYGMPWTEVGDRLGLLTEVGGLESFLFRRTMNGIQKPRDTFESKGNEYTKPINNYSYKSY